MEQRTNMRWDRIRCGGRVGGACRGLKRHNETHLAMS